DLIQRARTAFQTGRTLAESFRLAQLEALVQMLEEHQCDFVDALGRDLHKPRFETIMSELILVKNEALYATDNLRKWMQPQRVERNLVRHALPKITSPYFQDYSQIAFRTFCPAAPGQSIVLPKKISALCEGCRLCVVFSVRPEQATSLDECLVASEPLGLVLIVGSWCSPVQLCLVPLVGAVAAGNCAIISPSECSAHTAELLHRLIPFYLDNECFHVILAGTNDLPEIVDLKFDHVFFTGSREEGRRVAQAAARTITPVTLVLGSKNPCYVDRDCEVSVAAQRIAWARFHNAGQSLVAPDYVLCHADVEARLVQALKCCVMQFYGSDPAESRSYGRLVNLELFNRTKDLLWRSGKVAAGGQVIEAEKYIAPTILTGVTETDPIMQKDALGPVLPVMAVNSLDAAIAFINKHEKPLCVYAYSSNSKVVSRLMNETSSGSFCSNDSILQSLMVALPFGGVGASGMGSFHGRRSFDTFSHGKSCLLRSTRFECLTYLRYPP
ncbi:unnamed protein product, partial [Tetraodon nigroviridis]